RLSRPGCGLRPAALSGLRNCHLKTLAWLASDGATAARGYGASRGSAVHGSNARTQAIHGLLAPYPRATASSGALRLWLRSFSPSPSGRGAGVRVGILATLA